MNFEPSAERAAALDARMRARLADSLDYVLSETGDELGVSADTRRELVARIKAGRQSPQLFGAYYDLVFALEDEDVERASRLARDIVDRPEPETLRIAPIQDRPADERDRYRRLFLEDGGELAGDTSGELVSDCLRRIEAGLKLLDAGFPAMAAEIRGLLREIVLAAGPEDPKAMTFDGASCYMLWGAILLNTRGQDNVLDTAQALAHESGHNLLFGFCTDGPLIENPDEELFASPLRTDPRPMDGVVHATYVVARMHQTLRRLLDAGVLDPGQQSAALRDLEIHARNFATGDRTIREGARLTRVGAQAIEAARGYMSAAA